MTKAQFAILTILEKEKVTATQRFLAEKTGISLGSVNKALNSLTECGYIKNNTLTCLGLAALEPYRVKRAVFIAAGFGSRMVPITLNTPKPLVMVHGKRIIDTLLDAVVKAGIEEIVLVRGYLAEQFDVLQKKYPQIKFVHNSIYNEANNISSVLAVRDLLENAYVFEADLVLSNPSLITKYQYCSNYLAVPVERTEDWCFKVSSGKIIKMGIGGVNCYQMVGISYWTKEDGKKLQGHIEQVFQMPGGKERYWDQVPLEYFIDEYNVEVRECTFSDVVEIDSFSELKKIDKIYDC